MNIQHCRRCQKLFTRIKSPYCAECNEEIEKMFNRVRDYMQLHEDADLVTIMTETGVEEKILFHLLREERLFLSPRANIPCQVCGKPIRSGRYCAECTQKMTSEFTQLESDMAKNLGHAYEGSAADRNNGSNYRIMSTNSRVIGGNPAMEKKTGRNEEKGIHIRQGQTKEER